VLQTARKTSNNLIGIVCPAYVLYSALQTTADCLPIDLQLIINKIFPHFHIYSVRVEELKLFCEFTETEYKTVLGQISNFKLLFISVDPCHSETRWLSLLPTV
jgi:hypothetical protein